MSTIVHLDIFGNPVKPKALPNKRDSEVFKYLFLSEICIPKAPVVELQDDGKDKPFPFQEEGAGFILSQILVKNDNAFLADEMGVGKTIQALIAIQRAKPSSVLIVVPKNIALNWLDEARKWAPEFPWEFSLGAWAGSKYTITTYENLQKWSLLWGKTHAFSWIVFDEAHMLKNASIKRYKHMLTLITNSHESAIVHLSGTPIMNYANELYPVIMPMIMDRDATQKGNGHLYVKDKYPTQFQLVGNFVDRYMYRDGRARRAEELHDFLYSSFMLRRLKKDVMSFLPAKRRSVIELTPTPEIEILIQQEQELIARDTKIKEVLNSDEALTNEEWEQLVNTLEDGAKISIAEMARLRHKIALAKLSMCYEHVDNLLENAPDQKFIIFGHHRDVMDLMNEHVRAVLQDDEASYVIDGSTPMYTRHELIKKFQDKSSKTRVLVIGLKVGSLGLTLTASSHIVFIEGDWVPAVLTQAESRVHRYGVDLDRKVMIQHLVVQRTMDATMAKRCVYKQKQHDRILDGQKKK